MVIRGLGSGRLRGSASRDGSLDRGDLVIYCNVRVPKDLAPEQRDDIEDPGRRASSGQRGAKGLRDLAELQAPRVGDPPYRSFDSVRIPAVERVKRRMNLRQDSRCVAREERSRRLVDRERPNGDEELRAVRQLVEVGGAGLQRRHRGGQQGNVGSPQSFRDQGRQSGDDALGPEKSQQRNDGQQDDDGAGRHQLAEILQQLIVEVAGQQGRRLEFGWAPFQAGDAIG